MRPILPRGIGIGGGEITLLSPDETWLATDGLGWTFAAPWLAYYVGPDGKADTVAQIVAVPCNGGGFCLAWVGRKSSPARESSDAYASPLEACRGISRIEQFGPESRDYQQYWERLPVGR